MATDDIQRRVTGSASAPATFTIPGNGQIRPKSIYCIYDGSSAAGAFKPALKITSDAGELVGIFATDDSVAAGASATVSWFPGGGLGGGASTTNAEWFLVRRTTTQTMAAGSQDTVRWTDLYSSDSSLFSLATFAHPSDAVQVSRLGVVLLLAWISPNNLDPNYTLELILNSPGMGVASGTTYPDVQLGTQSAPSRNPQGPQGMTLMVPDALPFQLITQYKNDDVANRNLTGAQMWGYWWPTGVLNPF